MPSDKKKGRNKKITIVSTKKDEKSTNGTNGTSSEMTEEGKLI